MKSSNLHINLTINPVFLYFNNNSFWVHQRIKILGASIIKTLLKITYINSICTYIYVIVLLKNIFKHIYVICLMMHKYHFYIFI